VVLQTVNKKNEREFREGQRVGGPARAIHKVFAWRNSQKKGAKGWCI
jgi:hypothetical protein